MNFGLYYQNYHLVFQMSSQKSYAFIVAQNKAASQNKSNQQNLPNFPNLPNKKKVSPLLPIYNKNNNLDWSSEQEGMILFLLSGLAGFKYSENDLNSVCYSALYQNKAPVIRVYMTILSNMYYADVNLSIKTIDLVPLKQINKKGFDSNKFLEMCKKVPNVPIYELLNLAETYCYRNSHEEKLESFCYKDTALCNLAFKILLKRDPNLMTIIQKYNSDSNLASIELMEDFSKLLFEYNKSVLKTDYQQYTKNIQDCFRDPIEIPDLLVKSNMYSSYTECIVDCLSNKIKLNGISFILNNYKHTVQVGESSIILEISDRKGVIDSIDYTFNGRVRYYFLEKFFEN